jgi:hypothetical protein
MWKAGLLRSPIITPSESNNKIDSQTFIELRAGFSLIINKIKLSFLNIQTNQMREFISLLTEQNLIQFEMVIFIAEDFGLVREDVY